MLAALRLALVMLCGLVGLGLAAAAVMRPGLVSHLDRLAVSLGLGVETVTITGAVYTQQAAVREALALDGSRSHVSLDLSDLALRVEALPWVKTATLARVLPTGIAVAIKERRPAVVWQTANHDVLLDADGRVLDRVARGAVTGLALVRGDGAAEAVPTLLALLADHREVAVRVSVAHRIASRRWSLATAGGTLVHLPADGVAAAMAWLNAQAGTGLLDRGLAEIDLRVAGDVVVRKAGSAVPSAPQTGRAP